ncbi:serine/threonine-protein kinase Nek3-like [Oscarella lobularis]|uniref:serine/threonine-protein kinase Nek3-like n=1 Tax=Oscarella lobularis TaxID=121494 RepID=UPI0033137C4C
MGGRFSTGEIAEDVPVSQLSLRFTSKYRIVRKIGQGAFGSAYEVREKATNSLWCAKVAKVRRGVNLDEIPEIKEMKKFDHPQIVQFQEAILDDVLNHVYIIMEFCDGGNLKQWIRRNRKHGLLTEPLILQMLCQICRAVHSCHQLQTMHRDLKPENILLDRERRIKLCDFGVARQLDRNHAATSFCGTPPYMSPEVFLAYMRGTSSKTGYDFMSEVWSIGCILLDMATCKGVFFTERGSPRGLEVADALNKSSSGAATKESELQQIFDEEIPPGYIIIRRILPQMLRFQPEDRITLEAILTDPEIREALETPDESKWHESISPAHSLAQDGSSV